jgi:hypothetical protein
VVVDYVRAYRAEDEDPSKGRVNGRTDFSYTIQSKSTSVNLNSGEKTKPENFCLKQNYPNPFSANGTGAAQTTIVFQLAHAGQVKLVVYNLLGKEIKVLKNEYQQSGQHEVIFNSENLSSGMYIYKLEFNRKIETRKMILMR